MFKHRTFIFLTASLLASALIVSSAVAQRGIVPVPIKDVAGNQVGLYKGSYALVIGVSDYTEGWQDLESVPSEVDDLVSALEEQGFHVVKMLNPNSRQLKEVFEDFIAQYGFDPDNRLLFFFSGHGYTRQVGNITKGYLVPTDAPIPEHDPKGFKNKALSMKQIITWAEGKIESKHALFLFDSCFSGTILTSRSRPPIPRPIRDSTNRPVRQFISAGTAGQLVPSQSVFVPYFIRALKGDGDLNRDGYVTGTELGLYLRDQIMGGDTHQTPQVSKSFNPNFNEGDFVFSLLGREQMEQSVDSIIREREKLEQDRLNLEEKRKRVAALQLLNEEKRKLKEEKQRLKEEQEKFARLMPRDNPSAKSGGKCPQPRKTKSAPGGISKKDKTGKANLANGKKIYLKTAKPMACKMCHGKKGDGGGKLGKALKPRPRNFTCAATMKKVSAGQMFYIIKNGSKGTGMFAHKKTLKDKAIWDVVKYIRTTFVK